MKSIFFSACLALGAGAFALVTPAQARVNVDLPGIHIHEGNHHDHWRHEEWRRREAERRWLHERRYPRYGYREWR